jgi:hypothetical protein
MKFGLGSGDDLFGDEFQGLLGLIELRGGLVIRENKCAFLVLKSLLQ